MTKESMKVLEDVLYVFFCYKQSHYLDETLPAAFQQTAWPSKLLIMDDCSPDDSHEKILSILESAPKGLNIDYRHNDNNVGLVAQINSLRGQYQGKLIIVQAGDDIAMPERIQETYDTWIKNDKPSLIIGGYDKISEQGEVIEEFESLKQRKNPYTLENILNRKCIVNGCCAAFTSDILDEFGPYNKNIINEDRINVLRAFFLNGTHYESKRWIQYRVGGVSSFKKETRKDKYHHMVINAQREIKDLKMNLIDAQDKSKNFAVAEINKRMLVAEYMANLPTTWIRLIDYSFRYFIKTGDYMNIIKVFRRLK